MQRVAQKTSALAAALATALALAGCSEPAPPSAAQPGPQSGASGDEAQASFATPDEAVEALVAAADRHDVTELRRLLGPGTDEALSSGDPIADRAARDAFVGRYRTKHQLVAGSPDVLVLQVDDDDWPVPFPLVRDAGRWRFDGLAGVDEIVLRRIGANELRTIDVMRGFVAAQEDYAAEGHDGAAAGIYAQKLRSAPGKHDGLYWEAAPGAPESPAGPLLAAAGVEGYTSVREPYHGYVYKLLTAQGPAAPDGARSYLVDGKLTGGFAVLAYPDEYGVSGVTTFMADHDGVVWQRDLGDETAQAASAIDTFDPSSAWTPIAPEG
jgi:DUF2950 family protein